jgi:uncharacterized membrane protein
MERMLVAIFDCEHNAHRASRVLEELDELGTIALNAGAIVTRDVHGKTSMVVTHGPGAQATLGGIAIGGLFGIAGGFGGSVIGAALGFVIGGIVDVRRARFDNRFVTGVLRTLERGRAAVVAQIDEDLTEAVDARLDALGGTVTRRELTDAEEADYLSRHAGEQS